uniref:Fibronectin type-II domain-containing protein n=1 Tax=Anolis carolinensis TaxID=28377 RepID=A0A803TD19_ANOCA
MSLRYRDTYSYLLINPRLKRWEGKRDQPKMKVKALDPLQQLFLISFFLSLPLSPSLSLSLSLSLSYEGNSNGKPCVFPFIYRDHTFHTCTNENSEDGRFWCATTGNYDKDKQWSYCTDSTYSNSKPCVFPFIYRDRTFHTCTNENSEDGRFWCATTGNYDKDKQWSYCASSSKSEKGTGEIKLEHFKSS